MSFQLGRTSWNKDKKIGPYNLSDEERQRRSNQLKLNMRKKGITHSKEHNNSVSLGCIEAGKNIDLKKVRSENTKSQWKNPEVRSKMEDGISKGSIGRWEDPESREKLWNSPKWVDSKLNPKISTKYFHSEKIDKDLYYHSSWELFTFQMLDKRDDVEFYDRCRFGIQYEFESKKHWYIPDILVRYQNGEQKIIEVKPTWAVEKEINLLKFQSAHKYAEENGLQFEVWTEKELFY